MSGDSRGNREQQNIPVYTVYPVSGGYQGNANYGFQYSHPDAPPPKYEDVINGRLDEQTTHPQPPPPPPPLHYEGTEPTGVVLVAPIYKRNPSKVLTQIITSVFLISFFIFLVECFKYF